MPESNSICSKCLHCYKVLSEELQNKNYNGCSVLAFDINNAVLAGSFVKELETDHDVYMGWIDMNGTLRNHQFLVKNVSACILFRQS
jgi:hypothetical protein